jgi:hypothetical protein
VPPRIGFAAAWVIGISHQKKPVPLVDKKQRYGAAPVNQPLKLGGLRIRTLQKNGSSYLKTLQQAT